MKIGVLSYENMPLALDGRDWQNIGDYVQSYAMIQILEEMHLTDTIEMISRFDLTTYDGDYILLMMNSFNILTKQLHFPIIVHPISNKIIPCYISYHLPSTLSPNIANFLRQNGPIGCRDEYTMNNMRKIIYKHIYQVVLLLYCHVVQKCQNYQRVEKFFSLILLNP